MTPPRGPRVIRRTKKLVHSLGASGASRGLVLADGVPLNDPFGGWVYWSRVPLLSIDHVEVMRGSGSELYGTDALGGVLQVFRKLFPDILFFLGE